MLNPRVADLTAQLVADNGDGQLSNELQPMVWIEPNNISDIQTGCGTTNSSRCRASGRATPTPLQRHAPNSSTSPTAWATDRQYAKPPRTQNPGQRIPTSAEQRELRAIEIFRIDRIAQRGDRHSLGVASPPARPHIRHQRAQEVEVGPRLDAGEGLLEVPLGDKKNALGVFSRERDAAVVVHQFPYGTHQFE